VYARLPDDIQLLALSLLTMADDEGYFRAEPALVRGDVQPFREDLASLSRGLQELSRVGWIDLASDSKQGQIGRIVNFSKHQRVDHPSPSKLKSYFLASFSRETRETLALEQGTGNREHIRSKSNPVVEGLNSENTQNKIYKGEVLSEIPPDQPALNYAIKIIDDLGMTSTMANKLVVEAAVKALVKSGKSGPGSYEFLLAQAKDAMDSGVAVDKFWFEDSKWRKNGKHLSKRQQEFAEARRKCEETD
jgi:hypothetical protein